MKEVNKVESEQTRHTLDGSQRSSLLEVSSKQQGSMESLVLWNLSKALEINRVLNFQEAISELQHTMEKSSRELTRAVFARPQERHLACALLAWQQLQRSADSLVLFAEAKRDELLNQEDDKKSEVTLPESTDDFDTASILQKQSFLMGPVVALPIHTKLVMRVEKTSSSKDNKINKQPSAPSNVIKKLEEASGCVELGCVAKLKELDRGTSDLRCRASQLSKREAERAELLERAEMAWRELEAGFQRRLRIADEKEEQYATRIATLIEERKEHKEACVDLIARVKEKADMLEKRKMTMQKCEEEVCGLACLCHQLNEQVMAVDSALADATTKFHQLDRECQLKEEQTQRRVKTLKSQLEAAQQFTVEAEMALRGELSALKEQIETVSVELLKKDEKNDRLKEEIEQLTTVKQTLVDDLEECNRACDLGLQGKVTELHEKTAELAHTREHALKCTCHLPVEAAVQAKRTPSLVALCCCSPGRRDLEACSCTSLRSKLLNDLLVDLFGGIRNELGDALHSLPCQMLKCLEDSHNWDHASTLKANLQNFFSKLLLGELDIAIATSIENYHAKWVGGGCMDAGMLEGGNAAIAHGSLSRPVPSAQAGVIAGDCSCWNGEMMKERIEELAIQMIDKRVNELHLGSTHETSLDSSNKISYESHNKASRGSRGSDERDPSVLYCHVPHPRKNSKERDLPAFLKRTHNDVSQLRAQIEDLKKDTIKKTDLKTMEENIVKLLQNVTHPDTATNDASNLTKEESKENGSPKLRSPKNLSLESTIKVHNYRNVHIETSSPRNFVDMNKNMLNYKKRPIKDFSPPKKYSKLSMYGSGQLSKTPQKVFRKYTPAYAVNMCLCPDRKEPPSVFRQDSIHVHNVNVADSHPQWARSFVKDLNSNQEALKDDLETAMQFELELLKETELTSTNKEIPRHENSLENVNTTLPACLADCICVNKIPSTSSVERLLCVLNKWKKDLNAPSEISNTKKHPDISTTRVILKNSDPQLNSNIISMQTLKKNSLQGSYKASSHYTNKGIPNSNKSSTNSAYKGSTQNSYRSNVQLVNKAVNSPTKVYSNIIDMDEIPEMIEFDKHSQVSQKRWRMDTDLLVDSNKELLLIISNSQNSLGREINKKGNKTNPLATESEFMGQTSLNKSIKNTCKCDAISERSRCKCADSSEDKTMLQHQNPSRGTEAYACDFKESRMQLKVKSNISNVIPCFNESSSKDDQGAESYYSPLPVVNFSSNNQKDDNVFKRDDKCISQSLKTSSNNITKLPHDNDSQELLHDYGYNVKFLGVTLNNADEPDSESFNDIGYEEENTKREKFVKNKLSFLSRHKSKSYTCNKTSTDHIETCQCQDKFEDLKQYFNDLLSNCKTIVANQDKSLDAQSFKDSLGALNLEDSNSKDFCLCCDDNNVPDDLEVNTFELIKDHLKSKLQELKFSSCKFTCVPHEQEEKLLTAILVKVKQVISESTKQVCKCSDISSTQGSWNRAYALLQEYLKTKIKRVQCVCGSPSASEENPLLPDVLDKVCHLIENDFDRLKNICHANDSEFNRFEIPVKEKPLKDSYKNIAVHRVDVMNTPLRGFDKSDKVTKEISKQSISQSHKQISKQSFLTNHKQVSQQSFLKTENMSSQVSKTFGKSKMCEIGSSCLQFEEKIDHGVETKRLEDFEQCPDHIELQQEFGLEGNRNVYPNVTGYQSLTSSESILNGKANFEINSKSESYLPLEHHPKLKPNVGECECAATIRYTLTAQKHGERIKDILKVPSISGQIKHDVEDYDSCKKVGIKSASSADTMFKRIFLPHHGQEHDVTDTVENSCDHYHRCLAGLASRLNQIDNDPGFHPIEYPVFQEKVQHAKSEMYPNTYGHSNDNPTCDCSLIPLCHVKMLVENIEDKLANCKCTCDSFSSNVCPVHSKLCEY